MTSCEHEATIRCPIFHLFLINTVKKDQANFEQLVYCVMVMENNRHLGDITLKNLIYESNKLLATESPVCSH